ncbi:MAG: 16S rRNA (cytosine(1402)-N(4))-methyltransferase RsmH [Deltaproteobacteria bacterium]|nr:16S rRNA (cytosine(1402)-N(4))-methyltransferase RsmH [Deltaproteobacteria bacterium]
MALEVMTPGDMPLLEPRHQPVFCRELLSLLPVVPGGVYVDGTVGEGGHADAILKASAPTGLLIGLDRDEEAVARVQKRLEGSYDPKRFFLMRASYTALPAFLHKLGKTTVDGIVLDLGLSSRQLEEADRGFSFQKEGPLDMRFDRTGKLTAWEIVNRWPEKKIADCLRTWGEESWSDKIAGAIIHKRRTNPFETTTELASFLKRAIPQQFQSHRIHAATKTFQALRIAVNEELGELQKFLDLFIPTLKNGGRAAIISFHSLEDRFVKEAFRKAARKGELSLLTKKPMTPTAEEILANPRARSAKLRVAERKGAPHNGVSPKGELH